MTTKKTKEEPMTATLLAEPEKTNQIIVSGEEVDPISEEISEEIKALLDEYGHHVEDSLVYLMTQYVREATDRTWAHGYAEGRATPPFDTEKFMLEGVASPKKIPLYTVSTMAEVFFARSSHWVRWLENNHQMILDGEPLTPIRTKSNARMYDLPMIEKIAHALATNEKIDAPQLRLALTIVRAEAQMWGYDIP